MGEAAAKEPTMEDILSSIRKIIAEEDGGNDKASAQVEETKPMTVSATAAEQGSLQQLAKKMASSDNEVRPLSKDESGMAAPEANPAVGGSSFADIAASVKETTSPEALNTIASDAKAAIASGAAVESEPVETPVTEVTPTSSMAGSLADIAAGLNEDSPSSEPVVRVEPTSAVIESEPVVETTEPEAAHAPVEVASPVEAVKAEEPAPVVQASAPSTEATAVPTQEEAEFKGALMSPSSNTSVTDSFDRLKRSVMDDLDAKTEAILRPMLREWLDENLPNMVERMVREEIERVARGI